MFPNLLNGVKSDDPFEPLGLSVRTVARKDQEICRKQSEYQSTQPETLPLIPYRIRNRYNANSVLNPHNYPERHDR